MRCIVDAQLPLALARWLATRGHQTEHVKDHDMIGASDSAIWAYAVAHGATVITKDADFAQRRINVKLGPAKIWIRLPNSRRQDLLVWFESPLPLILVALDRGETIVEVF